MSSFSPEAGVTGPTGATGPSLSAVLFPTAPLIDLFGRVPLGDDYITPFRDGTAVSLSGAGQVVGNGNFCDCLDSSTSYVGGELEQYITVATINSASSAAEQVMFFFADSIVAASFNGYTVEMHSQTTACIIKRFTAGVSAAGPVCSNAQTLVNGDITGVQIVRNGTTVVFKIFRNGTLTETVTDVTPPAAVATTTTPLFFGFEVGNQASIRLASYGGGASVALGVGATGPTGVTGATGVTGTATGPTGVTGSPPDITVVGGRSIFRQSADVVVASTTLANLTGLVFTFVANAVYVIDLYLRATSTATGTGFGLALDTSVAVDYVGLHFLHQLAVAGTVTAGDSIADNTSRGLTSAVIATASQNFLRGRGIVDATTNGGTAQLTGQSETGTSVTFKADSYMIVQRVA